MSGLFNETFFSSAYCVDKETVNCPIWAKNGECKKNPAYMLVNCEKSCKQCNGEIHKINSINSIYSSKKSHEKHFPW